MARIDELRLMTKVARMYYEQGLRQTEITDRLNMSQSTISRLLQRAGLGRRLPGAGFRGLGRAPLE